MNQEIYLHIDPLFVPSGFALGISKSKGFAFMYPYLECWTSKYHIYARSLQSKAIHHHLTNNAHW
jgi:hypothetical protein